VAFLDKPLVYVAVNDGQEYVTVLHNKRKIKLKDIFSRQELLEMN
jgi:hypothetical protein